jgi:PadR family transcriptional regulator, regulatory protein AphA
MYLSDMSTLKTTSCAILGLLSVAPDLSGYDMRKGIQNSIGYFWRESYGQLYPALKRLSADGLIAPSKAGSSTKAGSNRRERQTYVITDVGRAALREWLALPFHNEPPRNEFLLKLFFCREAAPGVAAAHVRDLNDRNRRALELLDTIVAGIPAEQKVNPHMPYWMMTVSLGRALTSAALEWGEKALAELAASEDASPAAPSQLGVRTQPAAKRPQATVARKRKTPSSSPKPTRALRAASRSERKVTR